MARARSFERAAAARAEVDGRELAPEIAQRAEAEREAERQNDLSDPRTQAEILAGAHYDCDLLFFTQSNGEEPKHTLMPIRVVTELSLGDIVYRNVLAGVDGFASLVAAEMRNIMPGTTIASSANVFVEQPGYVTAAIKREGPRNALIDILAKIAKTRHDDEKKVRPVTAYELQMGLDPDDLFVCAIRLLAMRSKDEALRKNARAAARA